MLSHIRCKINPEFDLPTLGKNTWPNVRLVALSSSRQHQTSSKMSERLSLASFNTKFSWIQKRPSWKPHIWEWGISFNVENTALSLRVFFFFFFPNVFGSKKKNQEAAPVLCDCPYVCPRTTGKLTDEPRASKAFNNVEAGTAGA